MNKGTELIKPNWQKVIASKDESNWLRDYREYHHALFQKTGLPDKKNEYWKYTDLSILVNKRFSYVNCDKEQIESVAKYAEAIKTIIHERRKQNGQCALLVVIDGCFEPELSDLHGTLEGMRVSSLAEALRDDNAFVQKYWPRDYCAHKFPFACINAALFNDGVFIHVYAKNKIVKPIHILSIATCQHNDAIHPRNLVVLEKESSLTLLEEFISLPFINCESYLINNASSTYLEEFATLNYIKLQQSHEKVIHFDHTIVEQKKETYFNSHSFLLSGKFSRIDLVVNLNDALTRCDAMGFYQSKENMECVDNHIAINHLAPHTDSTMLYKGIINDSTRAVFNGRVFVSNRAQKVSAYQANHNILLSDDAEIFSKPELEIYANDVKCKHGSTVGQIDQTALFYLRSRGITVQEAEKILIRGFAHEITQRIANEDIRHYVEKML